MSPPQQRHWWFDDQEILKSPRLPCEINEVILDDIDCVMGEEEAKCLRGGLMDERSALQVETTSNLQQLGWNFVSIRCDIAV